MWKFHFWIVDRAILKNLSLGGGGGRLEGYLKSVKEQNEKTGNLTLTWGGIKSEQNGICNIECQASLLARYYIFFYASFYLYPSMII